MPQIKQCISFTEDSFSMLFKEIKSTFNLKILQTQ